MRVLLDTNVLAELAKPSGNPAVSAAFAAIPTTNVFLSALTVGEIVKGVSLLVPGPKKTRLAGWLSGLENLYSERILSIDLETARIWGELTARAQKTGIIIPPTDGLLAATAIRHGLHVMTRNTKHFQASGALIIDPWATA